MKFSLSCVKVLDAPLTVKIRTGVQEKTNVAHKLIPEMKKWGVSMITVRHVKKNIHKYEGPLTTQTKYMKIKKNKKL